MNEHLKKELVEKYLNVYDDLRHYFYKNTASVISRMIQSNKNKKTSEDKEVLKRVAKNTLDIIDEIRTMPTDESEIDEFWTAHPESEVSETPAASDDMLLLGDEGILSESETEAVKEKVKKPMKKQKKSALLQLNVHKRGFSDCWMNLMKLPLSNDMYKHILLSLHKRILPHLVEPKMLMDFLTDSYNVGGPISLLALNGLFTLITQHDLEYPDFYQKLYTLLDRDLMHVKYKSRFFRLLDVFLSSSYLPAALIAAFIKRMARLSLTAPPTSTVIIIPFIYNLLKKHPTCMSLIHSNHAIGEKEDPFDMNIMNPYECHALQSSLWEVETLKEHYYANVSTLAKIFSEQFLKPKYNLEDFLDHTYATFFQTEIDRKRKKQPALAIEKPSSCIWTI